MSSSLHFSSLEEYRRASSGTPVLPGQTIEGLDNGYGLEGNATLQSLQDAISQLEKGSHTLLYPSGLTALISLSTLLKKGDHWLLPDSVYAPFRRFADYLKSYGITYDLYNSRDITTIHKVITNKTKLIHIENPCSVTFETTDVKGIIKFAQSKNIFTSADNTWASGVLHHPLEHGVDISVMSLTKYVSGYSDVFMGSLTTKDPSLFKILAYHHRVYGYTISPVSAMLSSRGLETLRVRLAQEAANAANVREVLQNHKKITKIYFLDPKIEKDFSGSNSLFSIDLDRYYTDLELEKLFSHLQTFQIGESWGGTRSLLLPFQPDDLSSRFTPPKNTIIRFHCGLEDSLLQIKDINAFADALTKL